MVQINITIGIPIYQVEDCLEASLHSALEQTYQNIEYILVDDCSTDGSLAIAKRMIEVSPRKAHVHIVHHDVNKGLGEARNTVIKYAKSDYIYFMDSDDTITNNCIEVLVEKAVENSYPDIVMSGYRQVAINGEERIVKVVEKEMMLNGNKSILDYYLRHNIGMTSWNKLYRTEFLHYNEIYNKHRFLEDRFFLLQELTYAQSILLLSTVTYNYILRGTSITGGLTLTKKSVDWLMFVQQDIHDFIKAHGCNSILYVKCYLNTISFIVYVAFSVSYKDDRTIIQKLGSDISDLRYVLHSGCNMKTRIYLIGNLLGNTLRYNYLKLAYKPLIKQ